MSRCAAKTLKAFSDSGKTPSEYGRSDDRQAPEGSTPAFGRLVLEGHNDIAYVVSLFSCRFPTAPDVAVKGSTSIEEPREGVRNCEFYFGEDKTMIKTVEKGSDREQNGLLHTQIKSCCRL